MDITPTASAPVIEAELVVDDGQALRDALRVQAAAVAAQQIELFEEEAKFHQKQAAWNEQQAQLSARLEEKQRVIGLRQRFVRRFRRRWKAERKQILKREAEAVATNQIAELRQLAVELSNQRLHLVEHWQRLAREIDAWHREHNEIAVGLEAQVSALAEKERSLADRESTLQAAQMDHRRKEQELADLRQQMAGWAARARLRVSTWDGSRDQSDDDRPARLKLAEEDRAPAPVRRAA